MNQLPKFGMAHPGAIWQKRAVGNLPAHLKPPYPWKHFGEHPKAAHALRHCIPTVYPAVLWGVAAISMTISHQYCNIALCFVLFFFYKTTCSSHIVKHEPYIVDDCQTATTSSSDHPASHLYLYSSIRLFTY